MLRILIHQGIEFNGSIENHEIQLYLAIEDIDRSKTNAHRPQTHCVCDHFYLTIKEPQQAILTLYPIALPN